MRFYSTTTAYNRAYDRRSLSVNRLRCERDELRKTVDDLQNKIKRLSDERNIPKYFEIRRVVLVDSETWDKDDWLAAFQHANETLQLSRTHIWALSEEVISLRHELQQTRTKTDYEKRKSEEQHNLITARMNAQIAQLERKVQQGTTRASRLRGESSALARAEKRLLEENTRATVEIEQENEHFRDSLAKGMWVIIHFVGQCFFGEIFPLRPLF